MAMESIAIESKGIDEKYWVHPSNWDKASDKYNNTVGFSSSRATPRLVELANTLSPLNDPCASVLELGAGTGSLTHALARRFPELAILATDVSVQMLAKLMQTQPFPKTGTVSTAVLDMSDPFSSGKRSGTFSHVVSSFAMQSVTTPDDPVDGCGYKWMELLKDNGVLAIATWDFDEIVGAQDIWEKSVRIVEPTYTAPAMARLGQWMGHRNLEKGMKSIGCRDVRVEVFRIGMDVGSDAFMEFFWESQNPWIMNRVDTFKGDKDRVREAMRRTLEEQYQDGWNIPLCAAVAVGRKPPNWTNVTKRDMNRVYIDEKKQDVVEVLEVEDKTERSIVSVWWKKLVRRVRKSFGHGA